jgi:hypothetical protein
VNQGRRGGVWRVGSKPAQTELDRGQRLADLVQLPLPLLDLLQSRVALGIGQYALQAGGIDRVNPGQRLSELGRQALARPLVLGLSEHPGRHRCALDEAHQHSRRPEAPVLGLERKRLGDGHAGLTRLPDQRELSAHRHKRLRSGGIPPNHPASLAGFNEPGLPRGAARNRTQRELARLLASLAEHLGDARSKVVRHTSIKRVALFGHPRD